LSYDPELLARNDAAIFAATERTIQWLRAKGVGWIVVDRRFGWESQSLPRLAKLRWSKENIAIYEVPAQP
jgi:hypothetical protein